MSQEYPLSNNEKRGRRIGILGGTFDPIHLAHLHMAEEVRLECDLDVIWFIPAQVPPHKQKKHISCGEDRLIMIEKAIEGIPYFHISRIEFEREGPSFTIETIRHLKRSHPDDHFFFIIGADMVEYLPYWYQIEELSELVTFIGVGRPGWNMPDDHKYQQKLLKVETIPSHISSTVIRERRKKGQSIRFLVPEAVFHYIEEKHLYE